MGPSSTKHSDCKRMMFDYLNKYYLKLPFFWGNKCKIIPGTNMKLHIKFQLDPTGMFRIWVGNSN